MMASPSLYLCTQSREDLSWFLTQCIKGGVDIVQLREKHLEDKKLLDQAKLCAKICDELGVLFIVNDRPDIALLSGADGVHLGQDDLSPSLARRILGPDAVVGLSTHGREELDNSLDLPVDYISVGPIVETPTKPGRKGTGIGYLDYASSIAIKPFYVTGGVTPQVLPELYEHGARGFVVVRYLTTSTKPYDAARKLRDTLDGLSQC